MGQYSSGADLIGADLIGADLIGADLIGADLIGADLIGADLIGADLIGTDLYETDFENATLKDSFFGEMKLCYDAVWSERFTLCAETANWSGTIYEGRDWAAQHEWEAEKES